VKVISVFSGVGGLDKGFEEAGCEVVAQVEIEPFCQAVLKTHWPNVWRWSDIKTFSASLVACLVKIGPSPANAEELKGNALDLFTSLRESCKNFDPLGLCSRMFPDFSVPTTEETLRKSSGFSWSSAGMGFAGVCSTRNFSESPKDAVACSLSEVLEDHAPQRFFLTPRAAKGILRRAAKRGRTLPHRLQAALESLATHREDEEKTTKISPTVCAKTPEELGRVTTQLTHFEATNGTPRKDLGTMSLEAPQKVATNGMTKIPIPSSSKTCAASAIKSKTESASTAEGQATPSTKQVSTPSLSGSESEHSTPAINKADGPQVPKKRAIERLSVRRLTPTECETLQGFPKGWTVPDTEHWATRSRSKSRDGLREES
jgi:site-specific DNA-cytosine methylase